MNLLTVLPLAVVMVAGPQLISALFLAASRQPRRSSLAYLAGTALGILVPLTVWYVVFRALRHGIGGTGGRGSRHVIDWLVLGLLLALPLLTLVLLGDRGAAALPKLRDRANAHSWVVSEFVILIFVVIVVADLA
ncbi:hypothetical protein [Micromonospora sp. NPDC050495]|uniref:hypothetical protein n=1 Tax=Micromonospora sp. NPDC050495 TaxID=3154936 RepID=UPI0034015B03